jgi:nucleotide-binding universal stress UspA family protein
LNKIMTDNEGKQAMQLRENPARLCLEDILVVSELPPSADGALPYGFRLAREHRAKVHIAHAAAHLREQVKHMPSGGGFRSLWRDAMQAAGCQRVLVDTLPATSNLQLILEQKDFDLVIASAGQRESGGLLGELATELLKASDCPLVLLGPRVPRTELLRSGVARILHATDFSPQALAAAQHAFSWAQEYMARLTMLHVVEGVAARTDEERILLEAPFQKWMAELVPEELPLWCELEHRVEFGTVAPSIVTLARELEADLIVIGLSGLDGADPTITGETASQVIRQSPCPVLVIREYMTKRALLEYAHDRRSRAAASIAA